MTDWHLTHVLLMVIGPGNGIRANGARVIANALVNENCRLTWLDIGGELDRIRLLFDGVSDPCATNA